ncbi:PRC-barrel domain-containing protein [Candidatus Micrarchaeota archaeon]|jgi:sporulation protein YlmC with PRC-barrel domain|nr:PRC-barrel domain-containing protein [Candidatus Micrarchaeota archaeon]
MTSKKFVIAKQLGGKRLITNKGEEIGRLSDILVDERSGKIEAFLIEPNSDSKIARNLMKHDSMPMVPFKSVFAVSDVIVADESMLV